MLFFLPGKYILQLQIVTYITNNCNTYFDDKDKVIRVPGPHLISGNKCGILTQNTAIFLAYSAPKEQKMIEDIDYGT